MHSPEDYYRLMRQLELRIVALERELAGLRSERRPRLNSKRTRYKAVVTESGGISYGGSGEVTIYRGGVATTWTPQAYLEWMHSNKDCSEGAEVIVEFFDDENRFDITNGECEAP